MQRTWKNQFGADYDVPDAITKHPLIEDSSWGNDMAPCFHTTYAGATVSLWVEHVDPNMREDKGGSRYTVARYAVDDSDPRTYSGTSDGCVTDYEGDDLAIAIRTLLTVGLEQARANAKLAPLLTLELLEQIQNAL